MTRSVIVRALALILMLVAAPPAAARTLDVPAQYGSLESAYLAAEAGDTIRIAAGLLGPQEVPYGTKPVTVQGAPGSKLRKLDNYADNITFDGLDVDAGMTTPSSAVFEAHAEPGGHNVTFKNGRIGGVIDQKGAVLGGTMDTAPLNLLIDNVEFHDVLHIADGVHNECVFTQAPGLTIRNSTFVNCATMDIFVIRGDWWGQPPYGGITLENNVFGHSVNGNGWHYYSLYWTNGAFENARVVNNTFENSVITDNVGAGPYSGVWANNIGGGWDCLPGVTYRGNVGTRCDGSDRAVAPASSCAPPACPAQTMPVGWANPLANDFRLTPGSVAIDAGDPEYAPTGDRDCRRRDARPDAGAYEFGASGDSCAGVDTGGGGTGGGGNGGNAGNGGGGNNGGGGGSGGGSSGGGSSGDGSSGCGGSGSGGTVGGVGAGGGSGGCRSAGGDATLPGIRAARLGAAVLCLRARPGCPAATRLQVVLTRRARVAVRIESLRPGRERTAAAPEGLRASVRISARGLRPGRYRLRVVATDGAGLRSRTKVLTLRVRH